MKKIDKIDGCYHCPLRLRRYSDLEYCTHESTEGNIISPELRENIPEWCPLPDDASQSAKPGHVSYPVSSCPADANTPPNSRQPGANDSEVLNECDPEGMKPKSKYEKAEAVRKYVLGENYRDVKE